MATVQQLIAPSPGPQEAALRCNADILIFGGSAGCGKTYALLLEPMRHLHRPGFNAVIFRRTSTEHTAPGSMWDVSHTLYPQLGGIPNETDLAWYWPDKDITIKLAHVQHERDKLNWHGSQIVLLCYDELTTFTESQFWYLLSRNRSTCGVRPYVRATTNPDADSWVAEFIKWWWNPDTGYPIPERSGVLRWFVRLDEKIIWADTWEELYEKYPDDVTAPGIYTIEGEQRLSIPKSVTFIGGKLSDNKPLMAANPEYLATLRALPQVERERLLEGNWLIRHQAGLIFPPLAQDKFVDAYPTTFRKAIRYWDKAATTEEDGGRCFSAGVMMLDGGNGLWYVADAVYGKWGISDRNAKIKVTAALDEEKYGERVVQWLEQEPGSGGKESAIFTTRDLVGYNVKSERVTGDKITRAIPFASQWQAGNIRIVRGAWNKEYLDQHDRFYSEASPCDLVDASSGAFNKLIAKKAFYMA